MLSQGDRVGRYEIVSPLGSGGMGEVYRALDTELGRDVALKTLPDSFQSDPGRLARFEREARVLASLNHPGIATLYGMERIPGGPAVLVLEFVDGATLSALLPRPVDDAIEIARQIAQALEAAHARGVLHCDLKPSNVRLTPEGRVKLLDFGVSRMVRGDSSTLDLPTASATRPEETGGTAPYMSPEQLRGEALDRRSDVWAFGCIFFELLTGRRPFPGSTVSQQVASVLEREPDWEALPQGTPAVVSRLVERCLRKKRHQRLRDVGDASLELEELLSPGANRAPPPGPEERRPYPGLRPFTEDDAAPFFGREDEVAALWRRLESRTLLAVIGPSGAGKTSFVRAGVVAARPSGWATLVTTPGKSPFLVLGQALAPLLASDPEALRQLLRFEDAAVAYELLVRWRKQHGRALLVVDQLEELFTLNAPETRDRFASLLGRLADEGDVHVLLSLRDDFLMRCQEHPALLHVFESLIPLGPLTGLPLRRALIEPAARLGVEFEDDSLVEEMLASVEGERGGLPLLAFALSRLWEMRDRNTKWLSREAYELIGGVSGALAQHAEATLGQIGTEHEALVREIFRNLVTAQGTRAEVERDELLSVFPDRDTAEAILDRLINARLLTAFDMDDVRGQSHRHRIEIVHESLLRAWPRVVRWQAQDAEGLVLRDQLKQAASAWDARGRSDDLLWSGTAYREFELWRERHDVSLTALEGEFASAMIARDRKRKRRWQIAVGGIVAASLAVAGVVGLSRQQEAAAHRRAEASRLVALGRLELELEPTAALAYARKSLEIHDTAAARSLAVAALWNGPPARVLSLPPGRSCANLAATSDGRWLACGSWGRARGTGRPVVRLGIQRSSGDAGEATSREQRDGTASVWSIEGGPAEEHWPESFLPFLEGEALVLSWTPTGGWEFPSRANERPAAPPVVPWVSRKQSMQGIDSLRNHVLYSRNGSLYLHSLGESTSRDTLLGEPASGVRYAGFHERSNTVISIDESNDIRVWSLRSRRLLHTRQGLDAGIFSFPRLDPTGSRLAWHSVAERAAVLWDLAGPPDADPLLLRRRSIGGNLGDMVFLGDGRWLASAMDDAVTFWPMDLPWPRVLRGHASAVVEVAFSPDSRHLVSCGNDGARIWPVTTEGGPQRPIEYERPYSCYSAAVDPAGAHVLIAATAAAGFRAPLAGGVPETLVRVPATESIRAAALGPDGHWAAVAAVASIDAKDRRLHVIDQRTREVRSYPLPGAADGSSDSGGVYALRFVGDRRLLSVGHAGVLLWDPATGKNTTLYPSGCGTMDSSADGWRVVVGCLTDGSPESFLLELKTGARRQILGHGGSVQAVAIDPSGEVIATGDNTGVVRVGRWNESSPHLLLGASGVVSSVDFSPDGRWVAAAAGKEIWLWSMPDLSAPPLQALPRDELLAKLDTLTNLRLVEDGSTPTGYKVEIGPFQGWDRVPTW